MSIDYGREYGKIHKLAKRFPGYSLGAYLGPIAELVKQHGTTTMLDWACGKARGYADRNYHEAWGGIMPTLYDVGVPEFSKKPQGQFGGVIASDVMEHIAEADVPGVLDELIGYVEPGGWLFLGISCRPANKSFKGGALDGQNLHLTVRPPSWWIKQIDASLAKSNMNRVGNAPHVVAHWDIDAHFDEPETPWDSLA